MAVRMPAAIQVPRRRLRAEVAEKKLMSRGSALHAPLPRCVRLGVAWDRTALGSFTRKG